MAHANWDRAIRDVSPLAHLVCDASSSLTNRSIRPLSTLVRSASRSRCGGILTTILNVQASVVGEALGVYCLTSWSPTYVHLYTAILITVSVSIAMYCVVRRPSLPLMRLS